MKNRRIDVGVSLGSWNLPRLELVMQLGIDALYVAMDISGNLEGVSKGCKTS